MGPLILGEEHIHLTFFINGEVINAHLKIKEHGRTRYENLVTMTMNDFKYKARQAAAGMLYSIGYADPNQDAILLTGWGSKLFRKLFSCSLEMTYKGRTGYIDFDSGIVFDEFRNIIDNPSEFVTFGKARDLIGSNFGFGVTENGTPLFGSDDGVIAWNPSHRVQYNIDGQNTGLSDAFSSLKNYFGEQFYEVVSVTGIPQLLSEIERRKLFEKWFHTHRTDVVNLLQRR